MFASLFCYEPQRGARNKRATKIDFIMTALKAGVAVSSLRRPLGSTVVCSEYVGEEGDQAEAGSEAGK